MELDFKDLYIGYPGNPYFVINKIIEDDAVRVIVQKYEMILFTNKGDLLGDPNFGCNLEMILFQTNVSAFKVNQIIQDQIETYIPELVGSGYTLDSNFLEDQTNYQDVLVVNFTIADYQVYAIIT